MKWYIIILGLALLVGSCDIFTVREAAPPDKPPEWSSFYITPDSTLKNIRYSYIDARNVVKYSELFLSNYRFYFAAQDINDYGISTIWDRDAERDMLYRLHNWAANITLNLETIPDQQDDIQSNEARIYRAYTITVQHSGTTRTYSGKMELLMRRDNGFWRILNWYDYRLGTNPPALTWGKLKYDFSL